MTRRILVIASLMAAEVLSTPPDIMTADLVMVGGSDSTAVFLVSTGFNHGSHYLWETGWFLLAMDLRDFSFDWESLGSMMHAAEDFGGNSFETPLNAPSIPAALQEWGADRPLRFRGFTAFSPSADLPGYSIRDSLLIVRYGDSEYPLTGARCFDPGYLAVMDTEFQEYYVPPGENAVREIFPLQELPRFFEGTEGSVELRLMAEASLDTLHLFVMRVVSDAMPFDVIFTVPLAEMQTAGD